MAENIRGTGRALRRREVEARVGLGRTTIYDAIKQGRFPPPVRVSARAVRWLEADIDCWLAAKIGQRPRGV